MTMRSSFIIANAPYFQAPGSSSQQTIDHENVLHETPLGARSLRWPYPDVKHKTTDEEACCVYSYRYRYG